MSATIGDWFRLIEPLPEQNRLGHRREAAAKLTAQLQSPSLSVLDIVSLATELFSGSVTSRSVGATAALPRVLDLMAAEELGADRDELSHTIEPSICAAFALEGALRSTTAASRRNGIGPFIASAIVAAMRHRRPPEASAFALRMGGLLKTAEDVLAAFDERRRERRPAIGQRAVKLEGVMNWPRVERLV